jgi:coatomer subunit beta
VSSTETGVIFGNVVYDKHGSTDPSVNIVLNDVHVDIMDYIKPAYVNEAQFRSMWTEFEWENKVNVNTGIRCVRLWLSSLALQLTLKLFPATCESTLTTS